MQDVVDSFGELLEKELHAMLNLIKDPQLFHCEKNLFLGPNIPEELNSDKRKMLFFKKYFLSKMLLQNY